MRILSTLNILAKFDEREKIDLINIECFHQVNVKGSDEKDSVGSFMATLWMNIIWLSEYIGPKSTLSDSPKWGRFSSFADYEISCL